MTVYNTTRARDVHMRLTPVCILCHSMYLNVGPYTERKLEALTGTRLWLPAVLAAEKQGVVLTTRPQDDPSNRQAWLGPGSGPRFKSPADREAAARVREATLASGRSPTPAALEKALGMMSAFD